MCDGNGVPGRIYKKYARREGKEWEGGRAAEDEAESRASMDMRHSLPRGGGGAAGRM